MWRDRKGVGTNSMKLTKLSIQNYKSLRSVQIEPRDFSAIIGRNSSGKSNFADALEFLSIAYSDGLEHAVARKGGYEAIAHRKERRSRSSIGFAIEIEAELDESDLYSGAVHRRSSSGRTSSWVFRHSFEFRAAGEGIRSEFKITSESLEIIRTVAPDLLDGRYEWLKIERTDKQGLSIQGDRESGLSRAILYDPKFWSDEIDPSSLEAALQSTELLFVTPFFRPRIVGRFLKWVREIAVFQLSPDISRHSGVPTPNPHMSARGENLPAVVDWLQRKKPKEWRSVLQAMRDIVPEIDDITVGYLHTRALGLYFHEIGVGRPWTAEEVSDGTIRSLSMLVACYDPRNSALIVEEPENSLHPWIIKEVIKRLRELSERKLVMVTSHSPVVLNLVSPEEVWVIFKNNGETQIRPLTQLDPDLMGDWVEGKYRLFDYLESGYVREAVP